MAAGSRTRYALDLDCVMDFPDSENVPIMPPKPGESWQFLTEIVADVTKPSGRPQFRVKDKYGYDYLVVFFTKDAAADSKGCQVGRVLAVKNGQPARYRDGTVAMRIERASDVEVIPCSLRELWARNKELNDRYKDGLLLKCTKCDLPAPNKCGECKTKYCTRECQVADWASHKSKCKALKVLHQWNRTDWG